MGPLVSHLPCDLNQQRKRRDAKKRSVALAVARKNGYRSLLDRVLRRRPERPELTAEDLRTCDGEDVFHAFRF